MISLYQNAFKYCPRMVFGGLVFILFSSLHLSCSNQTDSQVSQVFKQEFEKTYHYVIKHKNVDSDYSQKLKLLNNHNKDALTSIAYRWHTYALQECQIEAKTQPFRRASSYEKILNQKTAKTSHSKKIYDQIRPCLAEIYFNSWSEIQSMIAFHLTTNT